MHPPARSLRQQQQRFDAFRQEYNEQRPHQGLGQQVPAAHYVAAQRSYPQRLEEPQYAQHWQVRTVQDRGQAKWGGERFFLSHALRGRQVGFEPIGEPLWRVWFHHHWLGVWDESRSQLRRPGKLRRVGGRL